jgi:hypothetical protein
MTDVGWLGMTRSSITVFMQVGREVCCDEKGSLPSGLVMEH